MEHDKKILKKMEDIRIENSRYLSEELAQHRILNLKNGYQELEVQCRLMAACAFFFVVDNFFHNLFYASIVAMAVYLFERHYAKKPLSDWKDDDFIEDKELLTAAQKWREQEL